MVLDEKVLLSDVEETGQLVCLNLLRGHAALGGESCHVPHQNRVRIQ